MFHLPFIVLDSTSCFLVLIPNQINLYAYLVLDLIYVFITPFKCARILYGSDLNM
jgi:hypothetical protein